MSSPLLGVDVTIVKTSSEGPEWPLGTEYTDPKTGKRYRYINADTAIADGDILTPTLTDADVPFSLVPAAAVNLIIAGVGIGAIAAEGFGWCQIHGIKTSAKVADAVAQGAKLGTSSTAGRLVALDLTDQNPTQAELRAALTAGIGIGVLALTDGDGNNLGTIWLE